MTDFTLFLEKVKWRSPWYNMAGYIILINRQIETVEWSLR